MTAISTRMHPGERASRVALRMSLPQTDHEIIVEHIAEVIRETEVDILERAARAVEVMGWNGEASFEAVAESIRALKRV